MTYPSQASAAAPSNRPASWLPDPLNDALLRYWDGFRWTFHTAARPQVALEPASSQSDVVPESPPARRPDIAAALENVHGTLMGSMKEVNALEARLGREEHVIALTGAHGDGLGVLACTNHRLLFLFVGLIREQFLHVNWNDAKELAYDQSTKSLAVYTTKRTKRAVPAMAIQVANLQDAKTIAKAVQKASAAPRLDII